MHLVSMLTAVAPNDAVYFCTPIRPVVSSFRDALNNISRCARVDLQNA